MNHGIWNNINQQGFNQSLTNIPWCHGLNDIQWLEWWLECWSDIIFCVPFPTFPRSNRPSWASRWHLRADAVHRCLKHVDYGIWQMQKVATWPSMACNNPQGISLNNSKYAFSISSDTDISEPLTIFKVVSILWTDSWTQIASILSQWVNNVSFISKTCRSRKITRFIIKFPLKFRLEILYFKWTPISYSWL